MAMTRIRFIDIDSYIGSFPEKTQKLLQEVRETIRKEAPEAEQTINYGIPTFKFRRNLVHFAGFKKSHWILSDGFRN